MVKRDIEDDPDCEERSKQEKQIKEMADVFDGLDINHSGGISKVEWSHCFYDAKMTDLLAKMKLDSQSAEEIFDLLDRDRSGQLSVAEFVLGCMRLQGEAR